MEGLTDFEKKVYQFFLEKGEISLHDIPRRMMGAIPKLKRRGLIDIIKKTPNPWTLKKHKFIIVKNRETPTIRE